MLYQVNQATHINYPRCKMTVITPHPINSSPPVLDEKEPEPKPTTIPKSNDDSSSNSKSEDPIQIKSWQQPTLHGRTLNTLRTIQRYIWDDPDKSPEEKRFLLKLDFFLLTYGCLGYFCKNLDQANVNNAYVSGMKESLQMNGSQLTYASNVFTAGYVISEIPAVMLVTRVRASILIPTFQVSFVSFGGWMVGREGES